MWSPSRRVPGGKSHDEGVGHFFINGPTSPVRRVTGQLTPEVLRGIEDFRGYLTGGGSFVVQTPGRWL